MDPALQQFAQTRDPSVFQGLVQRHVNPVYAQALRQLQDPALAEDVTQGVFLLLWQEGHNLSPGVVLGGWLHRATHYACMNALRRERRRRHHEHTAAAMRNEQDQVNPEATIQWDDVAPHLDDLLERLPRAERDAVTLKYLDDRSTREIGDALGVSEDAVRQRLSRGIARLRKLLARRGIVAVPAVALTALLETKARAASAVPAAPAHLATSIFTTTQAAPAASTAAIAQGIAHMIMLTKLKFAAAMVLVGALLATSVVLPAIAATSHSQAAAPVSSTTAPTMAPTTVSALAADPGADPHSLIGALHKLDRAFRAIDEQAADDCFIYSEPKELNTVWLMVRVNMAQLRLDKAIQDATGAAPGQVQIMQPTISEVIAHGLARDTEIVDPDGDVYRTPLQDDVADAFEQLPRDNPARAWGKFRSTWRKVGGVWRWDVRDAASMNGVDNAGQRFDTRTDPAAAKKCSTLLLTLAGAMDDAARDIKSGKLTPDRIMPQLGARMRETTTNLAVAKLNLVPNLDENADAQTGRTSASR